MKKAKYIVAVILFVLWGQVGLAQGGVAPKSGESLDKETGFSFCPLDSIPDWVNNPQRVRIVEKGIPILPSGLFRIAKRLVQRPETQALRKFGGSL